MCPRRARLPAPGPGFAEFRSPPAVIMVAAAWYPGSAGYRVALEAMIKAPNEGRDYRKEAQDIVKAAAKKSRELDVALGTCGDISFNYESTDMPDVVETPTSV